MATRPNGSLGLRARSRYLTCAWRTLSLHGLSSPIREVLFRGADLRARGIPRGRLDAAAAALAALVPSLATTPKELVAANGLSMALEGVGTLIGPVVGGVLVAIASPGFAFAFGAAAYLLAMLLLAQVQVPGGLVLAADAPGLSSLVGAVFELG